MTQEIHIHADSIGNPYLFRVTEDEQIEVLYTGKSVENCETWRELVDAAHLYGWTLADNCELRNRKGTLVHIVKIRKRRVRLEDDNGTLRGTLPVSQAGPGLGRYLEKVFYAQKCAA